MIAPQELGVFHQGVLRQLFVEELVDVGVEAVPQLETGDGWMPELTNQSFVFLLHLYLNVQRGKVAVQLFLVVDVGLAAHWTHHVSDVPVSHGDGEVHTEALVTHGALAGRQRLHLKEKIETETSPECVSERSSVCVCVCGRPTLLRGKMLRQQGHSLLRRRRMKSLSCDSFTA